jgi:hypothetical protein
MKPFFKNILIGFAVLFMIVGIGTCSLNSCSHDPSPPVLSDTSFVTKWKVKKENLLIVYGKELKKLQTCNDSLQSEVSTKKKQLFVYQSKSKSLENRLKEFAEKLDSSHVYSENISPIVDSVVLAQVRSDSACNETIKGLEQIIANRDSSIFIYKNETATLRDLRKEQADREQILTEQLNIAFKKQKRIALKEKLLKGGLVLLSGFTGALLINQHLK